MSLGIYLAGPDVFFPNARAVGDRKAALCRESGFEGLFPLDEDEEEKGAAAIFLANRALMQRADVGFFNLTPFRGPSADVGTVFEVGFMHAQGKLLFGYTSSTLSYPRSVEAVQGPLETRDGRLRDRDGNAVEDFGLKDNLMIERAILESGGEVCAVPEDGPARFAALAAFQKALAALGERVGERS